MKVPPGELSELLEGTYEPHGVRRKMIPKPGGGERPLGIPTIRDRVAQGAAVLILDPIFEADFEDDVYAYRPGRSALDAVEKVLQHLKAGLVRWMGKLGLLIHPEKTRLCHAWEESFDFLGYTFGSSWWWFSKKRGIGVKPSKKAAKRLKGKVNALLYRGNPQPWPVLRVRLNRLLIGWANYFSVGATYQVDNAIWWHVGRRVRRFLLKRHKIPLQGSSRFSQHEVYGSVGVVEPARYRRQRRSVHALS